ncbi:flagellar assembly protein FliW [Natronospora cellulosivora (SeqCode)]
MELVTKYHGEIEIDEKEIIHFPQGIPGFLEEKDYVLLTLAKDSPFLVLQSTNTSELAFISMIPWEVKSDYDFEISEQVEELLEIEQVEDVLVVAICTMKDSLENMTINLSAPVVINTKKALAKQVIIDNSNYSIKHPVFPLEKQRQEAK